MMTPRGRVLGIDVGERRVGLAISDPTQTLARPLVTLTVNGGNAAVKGVLREVERLGAEDDGLVMIAVGLPTRLDGSPTPHTRRVLAFITALTARTALPIVRVDERLTSHEAESRLALRERDWRRRKARLDAAAAAVILQDYLDERAGRAGRACETGGQGGTGGAGGASGAGGAGGAGG
jgi:putative Holliday junction resolvase